MPVTQELADMHLKNHIDCIKKGIEPAFQLHELREHYQKQDNNQKWRKSAEQRKAKANRKGIKVRKKFDEMTEHKARAIKRMSSLGYKRDEICQIVHVSYDKVDSVLRGLTWRHIK